MGPCAVSRTDLLNPPCTSEHCHFVFLVSLRNPVEILDVQYLFSFRGHLFSQRAFVPGHIGNCISMHTSPSEAYLESTSAVAHDTVHYKCRCGSTTELVDEAI